MTSMLCTLAEGRVLVALEVGIQLWDSRQMTEFDREATISSLSLVPRRLWLRHSLDAPLHPSIPFPYRNMARKRFGSWLANSPVFGNQSMWSRANRILVRDERYVSLPALSDMRDRSPHPSPKPGRYHISATLRNSRS